MGREKNKTSESITGPLSGRGFTVGPQGYDTEDRLTHWERSDFGLTQSWNLSLVGDWNAFTNNGTTQNRTHGPTHELVTAAGQLVTHDAKGNMTGIPGVLRTNGSPITMSWDFDNKLAGADTNGDGTTDVSYQFDALGRRVARATDAGTTVFIQSGQQTIADYPLGATPGTPTYTYVYGSYIDEPVMRGGQGGLRYCRRNQQYSVVALTNGGGTVTERYAYSAYGTPTFFDGNGTARTTSTDNNRYTYTGREWDKGLDLYH